jgi:autophagy-related protein 5
VPLEVRLDSKELPANSDRSLECYYVCRLALFTLPHSESTFGAVLLFAQIQAPRIAYLPLLLPDIKRHLVEIVLDDPSIVREEEWWFEENRTGTIMKWLVHLPHYRVSMLSEMLSTHLHSRSQRNRHWPIGALYDNHIISAGVSASVSSAYLNTTLDNSNPVSSSSFDPTPVTPLRLILHLAAPPTDKLLGSASVEACKQAFMGQIKEADFLRWGNTKRVTGLRKQEQDGIWDGLRDRK